LRWCARTKSEKLGATIGFCARSAKPREETGMMILDMQRAVDELQRRLDQLRGYL
jgi:hypothetical protein